MKRKTLSSALKNLSFGQPVHENTNNNRVVMTAVAPSNSSLLHQESKSQRKKHHRMVHNYSQPVLPNMNTERKQLEELASLQESRHNYLNRDL